MLQSKEIKRALLWNIFFVNWKLMIQKVKTLRSCPLLGVLGVRFKSSSKWELSFVFSLFFKLYPLNVYFQAYPKKKCFLYILQIGKVKFQWPKRGVDIELLHQTGMDIVGIPPWSGCVSVPWLYYIYCIFNPVKYKWIRILNLPFKCIRLLMLLKEIPTNGIISGGFVCLF